MSRAKRPRKKAQETARDRSRAETRRRLVHAAAIEFSHHGVQGARIAAIATRARVAMGTFYVHFPDKQALFEEVIHAGGTVVLGGLRTVRAMPGTPDERDRRAMEGVVAFAERQSELFRLFLGRGDPEDPLQREVTDAIVALRVEELEEGQKSGIFRADLDPRYVARCEVGAVFHLLDWWVADKSRAPREAIIETLVRFRRYGVSGAAGVSKE